MYATLHVKLHQLYDNEILILNGYIPMIQISWLTIYVTQNLLVLFYLHPVWMDEIQLKVSHANYRLCCFLRPCSGLLVDSNQFF